MITRCTKLRGLGVFHGIYEDAPSWSKLTLIYGLNGRGKSTLTHAIRAIAERREDLLERRRRVGHEAPQVAVFDTPNGAIGYADGHWLGPAPQVLIFDSAFIREQVHVDTQITSEHRRKFVDLALGSEAVELFERVSSLEQRVAEERRTTREAMTLVEPEFLGSSFNQFANLVADPDIDIVVTTLEARIRNLERIERISSLTVPEAPTATWPPYADLAQQGEEVVAVDPGHHSLVAEHERRLNANAASWLQQGVDLAVDDMCPLCGQSIAGNALFAAMRATFAESLRDFLARLLGQRSALVAALERAERETIAKIEEVPLLLEPWREYVEFESTPRVDIEAIGEAFVSARAAVVAFADAKSERFDSAIDDRALSEAFERARQRVDAVLARSQAHVQAVQDSIATFRANLQTDDGSVREELAAAQRVRRRHTLDVAAKVDKVLSETRALEASESDLASARDEVRATMNERFSSFGDEVNELLKQFGAPFSLTKVSGDFTGGKARGNYRLELLGHPIDLSMTRGRFEEVLSEGDKRALAFALFVARARRGDLSETIIIVDDPMTSFDPKRKAATEDVLWDFARKAKQTVVLAHDAWFLRSLRQRSDERFPEPAVLCIREATGGVSQLLAFDLDAETRSAYHRHLLRLMELADASSDDIDRAQSLRFVIEGYVRARAPLQFPAAMSLRDMTNLIETSESGTRLSHLKSVARQVEALRRFGNGAMHPGDPLDPPPGASLDEIRAFARQALDVVFS